MPIRTAHSFQYTQEAPSTMWVVQHNLNIAPVVETYVYVDGTLRKILPAEVEITDLNTVTIHFSEAQTGVARCM
jgi:hypothetical protein